MVQSGFYVIKDEFFEVMKDKYLKGNKKESRPHYYCFKDSDEGIYWVIPLSSRIDKYKKIIAQKERQGRPCDIVYITKLDNGRESAFLIQDMFPITDKYIAREYMIGKNHLMLTTEKDINEINRRAKKILALLKRGVKLLPTQPDVLAILRKLKQELDVPEISIR